MTTEVDDPIILSDTGSDASDSEELLSMAMAIVQRRPHQDRAGRRTMYREPKSGSLSPDSSCVSGGSQGSIAVNGLNGISRSSTPPPPQQFDALTPKEKRFDIIAKLPPEISMLIFSFFEDVLDLNSASLVSKTWNQYAVERSLWAQQFKQRECVGWKTIDSVELLWNKLKRFNNSIPQSSQDYSNSPDDEIYPQSPFPQLNKVRSWLASTLESTNTKVKENEQRVKFQGNSPFSINTSVEKLTGPIDYRVLFCARHLLDRHWDLHRQNIRPIPLDEAKALSLLQDINIHGDSESVQEEYRSHPSYPQALRFSQRRGIVRARKGTPTFRPDVAFLEGHADSVYCVRIHPKPYSLPSQKKLELQGKYKRSPLYDSRSSLGFGSRGRIYSGSRDRTIKIWDADSGLCLFTLKGHEGSVLCMEFDEEVLLTGSSDSNVFIWDLTKIKEGEPPTVIKKLTEHNAGVLDVSMTDRYIMTCSKDATCRVYDRHDDYKTVHVYRGHGGPINAGGISLLDGVLHAVTASGEGSIQLWNLLTGELARTFEGHTKGLACVRIVGSTVISGSSDHTVRVWDAKTGKCLVRCDAHSDLVRAVAFDDVRKILISAGYDGHVKLYDLRRHLLPTSFHIEGGNVVGEKADLPTPRTVNLLRHRVFDVQMDATRVVSCGEMNRICVRDFTRGNPIMRLFV